MMSINQSMFISLQQPIGFSKRERLITGPLLVQIRYKISHHSRNSNREGVPRIKSKTFQSSWPRALLMSTLKMEPEQGRGQEGSDWKLQNRGGRDSSDAAPEKDVE